MYILKSVGVMSIAKVTGLIYGCLGVIFVPFFLVVGLVGTFAGANKSPFAGIFGLIFAVLMPLLYGAMGFVMGAIGAFLYNLIAIRVGGLELELTVPPPGVVAPYPIVPKPFSLA